MLLTIVAFLVILSILVLAHELGHLLPAKASGVKVEEFGLGYPPKIFSFKWGDTIYSLNAIPFGGFTRMVGEEDPTFPGSLASKSHAIRLLVLVSGSLMNILLPILLFTISYVIPHDVITEKVLVQDVAAGSPAQLAGIEKGDQILSINSRWVNDRRDISYNVNLYLGSEIKLQLQKPDLSQKTVTVTPRWKPPQGQGATGIMITGIDSTKAQESLPIWEAIPKSFVHSWEILVLFKNEIAGWFIRSTTPQLTGPIGIAQLTGQVVQAGISPLLEFASLISISLGVFNLFPFPGLDGGRIVFVVLEWIRRGRRISPKKEGMVHLAGFIILILLILVVTYYDILRIIQEGSIIP
jgi:regulator of sigma E protease